MSKLAIRATKIDLFRAFRHGLKDSRIGVPDTDGHLPWTRRLHGVCGERERTVSEELHRALTQIDGRIDVLARDSIHLIDQFASTRDAAVGPEPSTLAHSDAEVADVIDILRAKKAHRATVQRNADSDARLAAAGAEVSKLLSDRHHLIADARADLTSLVSYFDALVSSHRLGMERRGSTLLGRFIYGPARRFSEPLPSYAPYSVWYKSDVPLVTPGTAAQIELLNWTWLPFEHSSSIPPN